MLGLFLRVKNSSQDIRLLFDVTEDNEFYLPLLGHDEGNADS